MNELGVSRQGVWVNNSAKPNTNAGTIGHRCPATVASNTSPNTGIYSTCFRVKVCCAPTRDLGLLFKALQYVVMDQYEVLEELGSGSFGVVYKAIERTTGEIVAIKQVRSKD